MEKSSPSSSSSGAGDGGGPDGFSYGKVILAAVKSGDLNQAMKLKLQMKEKHACPPPSSSSTSSSPPRPVRRNAQLGVHPNLVTFNAMIDGHSRNGDLPAAIRVWEKMKVSTCKPNAITYNSMLAGFCRAGRPAAAKQLVAEMEAAGISPDGYTYSILFSGGLAAGDSISLLEELIRKGIPMDDYPVSIILNGLCKEGKLCKAAEILELLLQRGSSAAGEVVFNTVIDGFCRKGDMEGAFAMLRRMELAGVRPGCITYNTLINGLCKSQKLEAAAELAGAMATKGVPPSVETFNTLVNAYAKAFLFERGINPNAQTFNILIGGYCKSGRVENAIKRLEDMKEKNISPTIVTLNTIIDGLCREGKVKEAEELAAQLREKARDIRRALEVYEEVKKQGLSPTIATFHILIRAASLEGMIQQQELVPDRALYNALIRMYSCSGEIHRALTFREEMMEKNIPADEMTYTSLVMGWCRKLDMEEARRIFQDMRINGLHDFDRAQALVREMVEEGLSPSAGTVDELLNGLRQEGRMQEAELLYNEMSEKIAKTEGACPVGPTQNPQGIQVSV
ncbi:unnamed protein product [Spirodela intermedia]|uniref:Uncharacterized protein n=1 Tax=Spirodela intermedia TaxID=51605 RepID=A0A7I8IJU9_SPIIN|nr:unnamed protein product [Spirodela intermedia]CAA6658159.1 unnamed protein product [Spirodela intermedia]